MKNDDWTKNFVLPKTVRFVWNNSYVRVCVSVIMAWWPNAKFYFSVNHKIWLWIDQKNLQFTVDRRHYWPKVPNILHTYLSIQNIHFLLLCDFLSGTCWKKFPIVSKILRFLGFPVTKVHNVSHGPVKNVIFPFGQYLRFGFSKFSYIFMHTKRTFILYIFRPTKRTFITYLFRLTKHTVPITWPCGPCGTNLNNGCRKSNLTQQNQSLPMPIKT